MEINQCEQIEIDEPKEIFLGQVVNSKEEAYNLYQEHAFKMGFSVRKGRELYHDNEKRRTCLKEFNCSNKGSRTMNLMVKWLIEEQIQEQTAKLW